MGRGKNGKSKTVQNIILAAIVVYFLALMISQQKILDRNIDEYESIKTKTAQIEQENKALSEEIEEAGTDEYLERMIREKLGYVKPDETVFVENEE